MSIDVADSPSPLESKSICIENKIIIEKRNSQVGEIKGYFLVHKKKKESRRQVLFKAIILHQIHLWLPSCPNHPSRAHLQFHQCHQSTRVRGSLMLMGDLRSHHHTLVVFMTDLSKGNVHGVYTEMELSEEILFHFSFGCEKNNPDINSLRLAKYFELMWQGSP